MSWGIKRRRDAGYLVDAWAFGGGQVRHATFEADSWAAAEEAAVPWCEREEAALYAAAAADTAWWIRGDADREWEWGSWPAPAPHLIEPLQLIDQLTGEELGSARR